ncbi:MAG: sulfotransferase family 2 domain-containing protein [Vicingaceae bacterium]
MDITEDIVFLYLPKTGSTFTYNALRTVKKNIQFDFLYRLKSGAKMLKLKEFSHYNVYFKHQPKVKEHHGTYHQIPMKFLDDNHEVVSIIRNPFENYLSQYHYGVFKSLPKQFEGLKEKLIYSLPEFPKISFEEFIIDYTKTFLELEYDSHQIEFKNRIGVLSYQYIHFFAKEPLKFIKILNHNKVEELNLSNYFYPVRFLYNENLNHMLYELLKEKGYQDKHIEFIKGAEKKNVSKKSIEYESLLTDKLKNYILEKEALLFKLFPHYT